MRPFASATACVLAMTALIACVGTTGGALVDFSAAAAGASDATSPLAFDEMTTSGHVWHVALTQATLHVGAMYLDQAEPVSGAQGTECILPGTYVAEVLDALDVDLLSPAPQSFSSLGHGTTSAAIVGQVWLTGGDVDTTEDTTAILAVSGIAQDDFGATIPFDGTITIGSNRAPQSTSTGADPICKQRIVSPIPTSIVVHATGALVLRIDARRLFTNVDFAQLTLASGASTYAFSDDPASASYTQPSINLYENLRAEGTYAFSWEAAP